MKNDGQKKAAKMLATKIINDRTEGAIVITNSERGVELAFNVQPEEGLVMYVMLQRAMEDNFISKRDLKRAAKRIRKVIDNFMDKED